MRITFLHPELDFSDGTARLIASVRATLAAGHEVSVISRKGSRTGNLIATGATCFEGELPTHRWLGAFAAGRTRDRVEELEPDLLHVTSARLAPLAARIADALRTPYLLELVRPPEAPLTYSTAQLRAILLPCPTLVEKAVNKGNAPRELLRVIEHGPDLTRDWEPRPILEAGSPVLISFATLDQEHGVDVLVAAARILTRAGRKLNFLVLGNGPEEDNLRRMVREFELSSCFTINSPALKHVETALIQADLHASSLRAGSLGWSTVQALGFGIPSVVSAINSTFPLVEDRQDGLLVEPGDADKLAESIAVMLDNPQAARQMGVKAREKLMGEQRLEAFQGQLAELHAFAIGVAVG